MRGNTRTVMLGPLSALALGISAAGMAGGCSDTPATGTRVVEAPEVQKNREASIKDAMRQGAYGGVKYDEAGNVMKGAPSKK